VDRDGFYAELCSWSDGIPTLVAEAFWSDSTGEFTVNLEQSSVPFSVLEEFIAEARQRVPPTVQSRESNFFVNGRPGNGA
jgi:hypothetical protein